MTTLKTLRFKTISDGNVTRCPGVPGVFALDARVLDTWNTYLLDGPEPTSNVIGRVAVETGDVYIGGGVSGGERRGNIKSATIGTLLADPANI